MKIQLASAYGMCFGVRDALRTTHLLASDKPVTILGQLVHNQDVTRQLEQVGAVSGQLRSTSPAPTPDVVITAHGAADSDRKSWADRGHTVTDTTCPLVKKAHTSLALLVRRGYHPVVIGKPGHVEVLGLTGDFPDASIVSGPGDISDIPPGQKLGVISQTTQPVDRVRALVAAIEAARPDAEVRFVDTVCQPTKDRQQAIEDLAKANQVVVVVGGANSNNTRQLALTAEKLGATAYHIQTADEIEPAWFRGTESVGLTAGTSTPDETIEAAHRRLLQIARDKEGLLTKMLG